MKVFFSILMLPFWVIQSWFFLFLKFVNSIYSFWLRLDFLYKGSLFFLILQITFSVKPWINYDISFTEKIETISVSSKINLYLFFLEIVHLYIILFFTKFRGIKIILLVQFLIFILFNIGIFFPNPIITDIINKNDYSLNSSVYFFGFWCYINFIISIRLFIKYDQKVDDLNVTAS
jgi:hypothetical protein